MLLKNRNLVIAIVATLVLWGAIGYGFSSLLIGPINSEIVKFEKDKKDLEQKLSVAKARAEQLNKIQKEMADLQIEVAEFEKQLPRNRDLPPLLRTITHKAETYGIQLSNLVPGRPTSKGLYDEISYTISAGASFHSLGRFLTAIGKGDRLFAARNLSLTPAISKTDLSKTINANFTLIAFKYHG